MPPQQLDFPSLAFPPDRSVLTVREVAERWRCSERHVIDLIEEGKLVAFDIAGKHEWVRMPMAAVDALAERLGMTREEVIAVATAARPQVKSSRRARYRIPAKEGVARFMSDNHSGNV